MNSLHLDERVRKDSGAGAGEARSAVGDTPAPASATRSAVGEIRTYEVQSRAHGVRSVVAADPIVEAIDEGRGALHPTGAPSGEPLRTGPEGAGVHARTGDRVTGSGKRSRWNRMATDLTYLITTFALSLVGFVLLLPLFVLGVSTSALWIGIPILGFTLLLASGFTRENTELIARFTGFRSAPAQYRASGSGPKRLIRMVADLQLWRGMVHALLIAFPLRLTSFVVGVTWVIAGFGGLTFFAWSVFVPDNQGLGSLLLPIAAPGLSFPAYLIDSLVHGVVGGVMVLLAPFVTRTLVSIDVSIAHALLPGDSLTGND